MGLPRAAPQVRGRLQDGRASCARCTRPTPTCRKVIDVARGLEGLRRQDGIHAAAVVITNEPLTEYLPIQRKPEPGERPGGRADRHPVRDARRRGARPAEDGLPRPAQPRRASSRPSTSSRRSSGERPDIDDVPLDDDPTFELLRRGDSIGVFQLEGGPMRALMRSLAPTVVRRRRRPRRPLPARARWRPTCTTTTPTARTAASRSTYLHPDMAEALGRHLRPDASTRSR